MFGLSDNICYHSLNQYANICLVLNGHSNSNINKWMSSCEEVLDNADD